MFGFSLGEPLLLMFRSFRRSNVMPENESAYDALIYVRGIMRYTCGPLSLDSTGTSSSGPWVGSAFVSSVGTSVPLNLRRALYASLSSNPVNPEVLLRFRSFTILSYPRGLAQVLAAPRTGSRARRAFRLFSHLWVARLVLSIFSIHATAASQVPRSNRWGDSVPRPKSIGRRSI
jgi:hypothetical protein